MKQQLVVALAVLLVVVVAAVVAVESVVTHVPSLRPDQCVAHLVHHLVCVDG
jgi:hypothetical protein